MIHRLAFVFALSFTLGLISVGALSTASAHSYHTPEVCAATQAAACAHLGFQGQPKASVNTTFMLHFMGPGFDPSKLSNVSVKLWMDSMGHGSTPVTVTQKDAVHFEVSDAFFSMAGAWQVKATFAYDGGKYEIVIPVEVLK